MNQPNSPASAERKPLKVFRCTVYSDCEYGDPRPVVTDGEEWSCEKVAETASKARYSYWREVSEHWQSITLMQIHVKVVKRNPRPMNFGWAERMETANKIIAIIAKYGRHFFSENSDHRELKPDPFIAHFEADAAGELWFIDAHARGRVLVRLNDRWRRFSGGGTLRAVVEMLRDHIAEDRQLRYCFAEYWGYGEDMRKVADEVDAVVFPGGVL